MSEGSITDYSREIKWLKSRIKTLEGRVAKLERDSHAPADISAAVQAEVARHHIGRDMQP